MHLPKCEINPSVCFTIDLAQQFGLKVQTTHTDTHTHTQTHTHKAFTGKLTYPLSVLGCATCFALVLAVLSIPWRQVSQAAAAAEAAAATTVTATCHPLAPWRQPKFQPLWELAPTPAGKADNPR